MEQQNNLPYEYEEDKDDENITEPHLETFTDLYGRQSL